MLLPITKVFPCTGRREQTVDCQLNAPPGTVLYDVRWRAPGAPQA